MVDNNGFVLTLGLIGDGSARDVGPEEWKDSNGALWFHLDLTQEATKTWIINESGLPEIAVEALNFRGFFCSCKTGLGPAESAKRLGVPLKVVEVDDRYLKMLRNPKHGYGRNMNPCVDCKIFMLKEAKKYADEIGASFIFTGEVLDERPKSQHYPALRTIEEESGLKSRLLRPLSARSVRAGWSWPISKAAIT